jgi:hypothetical protein
MLGELEVLGGFGGVVVVLFGGLGCVVGAGTEVGPATGPEADVDGFGTQLR